MSVRILHTADLQIGRRPSRLPAHVDASPARAWDRIVHYAIEHRLDAVTLGGDIVDAENRFYEAYGPLEQGIRRLCAAGIPVIAVAGNHDVEAFPRIADILTDDAFHLLGRGGHWERYTLEQNGTPLLHIDGWSFPTMQVHEDPVRQYDLPAAEDTPVVGLVHGDLDQSQSVYAPLSSTRLKQHDITAWLLGHIHKPTRIQERTGPLILYPGSPQALDPGEPGRHGAFLLEFEGTRLREARMISMAGAAYEHLQVDLEGAQDEDTVKKRIVRATSDHLEHLARDDPGPLEHVVYRLHLSGRTPLHGALETMLAGLQDTLDHEGLRIEHDGITASVEKTLIETAPAVDLERLATGTGPPAGLARILLSLQDPQGPDLKARTLLQQAVSRLEELRENIHYHRLRHDPQTHETVDPRAFLHRQGMLLLDALMRQKDETAGDQE